MARQQGEQVEQSAILVPRTLGAVRDCLFVCAWEAVSTPTEDQD